MGADNDTVYKPPTNHIKGLGWEALLSSRRPSQRKTIPNYILTLTPNYSLTGEIIITFEGDERVEFERRTGSGNNTRTTRDKMHRPLVKVSNVLHRFNNHKAAF